MGNSRTDKNAEIKIDYDNVDVEDIMEQIKEKIASQPKSPEPEPSTEPFYSSPQTQSSPRPEGPLDKKARIKKVMLKLFKPIAPLIKFMVLPVHQEVKDTIQNVYVTNQRIDSLEKKVDAVIKKLEEVDRATIERLEELDRVREYTQLIHNLSHNLVVELTKLKIEHENLKLKARILEKDFEFLGKRERALESKVLG